MKNFLKTFLIAALGGLVTFGMIKITENRQNVKVMPGTDQTKNPVKFTMYNNTGSDEVVSFNYAAEKTVNSVVHVFTEYSIPVYDPLSSYFGRNTPSQKALGSGSGVIISEDGYIVTNNHVIKGAEDIKINTSDNHTFSATVVGTDPSTDIALLKIDATNLEYIDFGNSDESKIGDWVLAVGNPFNLSSTVTAGIISAKARNINLLKPNSPTSFPIESFIQTDAAVNPGNSGGALVNLKGQLIGINTAIASRDGSYSGYSFAVPSSIVQKVTKDLLEFGEVQRALIGIIIRDLNEEIANEMDLENVQGVLVTGLSTNGAAINSGIRKNDVIIGVEGIETSSVPELQGVIGRYRPGDKVEVELLRNGNHKKIDVILFNKIGTTEVYKASEMDATNILQADLRQLDERELRRLGLRNGIIVNGFTGDKLLNLGVKKGFIITRVDKNPVYTIEDLTIFLIKSQGGAFLGGIYPNGEQAYYGLGV